VLAESRTKAQAVMEQGQPISRVAAAVIVAIWLLLALVAIVLIWRLVPPSA
jgi:hypothetical protein